MKTGIMTACRPRNSAIAHLAPIRSASNPLAILPTIPNTAISITTRAATESSTPTSVMWLKPCSRMQEWHTQQPSTMRFSVQKARVRIASPSVMPYAVAAACGGENDREPMAVCSLPPAPERVEG